jgi:hypothetical protein
MLSVYARHTNPISLDSKGLREAANISSEVLKMFIPHFCADSAGKRPSMRNMLICPPLFITIHPPRP